MKKYMKIDLHVHTPASHDYAGDKSENGYLNLLRAAIKKNVNAIAITDHNTIAGYEMLRSIKSDLESKLSVFDQFDFVDNPNFSTQKKQITDELELFSNISILLGVEITINPGVHIIVIGNHNDVPFLNALLERLGYSDEKRGSDDVVTQMDVLKFLNLPELTDRIVFAPHIDSNKGIYEDIKKGLFRTHVFTADNLKLVSVNSSRTKTKIQEMLTQPDYRRSSPIGFINASDAHAPEDIGNKVSYFFMEDCSYEQLYNAIKNPETSISNMPNPRVIDSVRKILRNRASIIVEATSRAISEGLCACLNDKYGYLVLGYDQQIDDLIGIKENKVEIEVLLQSATQLLNSKSKNNLIDIKTYKLGTGNYVHIIQVNCGGSSIWSVKPDSFVFLVCDNHKVRTADIFEIEELVQTNLIEELQKAEKRQESHFEQISNELQLISKPVTKGMICQSIASKSGLLNLLKSPLIATKILLNPNNKTFEEVDLLGYSRGFVFSVQNYPTRLKDTYLRCTCPTCVKVDEKNDPEIAGLYPFTGDTILVSEQGGVYYVSEPKWYVLSDKPVLMILDNQGAKSSMLTLLAWLKSSLFLFYLLQQFGSANMFFSNVYRGAVVPMFTKEDQELVREIEILVEQVIDFERKFLDDIRNFDSIFDLEIDEVKKRKGDMIDEHNRKINAIALEIDKKFFGFYSLTEDQVECVYDTISASNIFNLRNNCDLNFAISNNVSAQ